MRSATSSQMPVAVADGSDNAAASASARRTLVSRLPETDKWLLPVGTSTRTVVDAEGKLLLWSSANPEELKGSKPAHCTAILAAPLLETFSRLPRLLLPSSTTIVSSDELFDPFSLVPFR